MFLVFLRCLAIQSLYERMSFKWVLDHQYTFLKALLYVINDLTNEVGIDFLFNVQCCCIIKKNN